MQQLITGLFLVV